MVDFYMKCNNGLKWVKYLIIFLLEEKLGPKNVSQLIMP